MKQIINGKTPSLYSDHKKDCPSYAVFGRSPFADLYLNSEILWSCAYSCRQAWGLSPYDHAHSFHISDESANKIDIKAPPDVCRVNTCLSAFVQSVSSADDGVERVVSVVLYAAVFSEQGR